jgi:hypothetical protein
VGLYNFSADVQHFLTHLEDRRRDSSPIDGGLFNG